MKFEELLKKIRNQTSQADISQIDGKLAFQFDLTGNNGGTFYIEIKDGKISVEPYEYIDKDALFTISSDDFIKLATGKLDATDAFNAGKLKIDGSIEKALMIEKIIKEQKSSKSKRHIIRG